MQDLRPGSAMAASFSSGDVSISAIGTVAYRNGSSVWGFGHPFEGQGRRALLIQDAYVYSVVNNPVNSDTAFTYKLAVPGHAVGVLTNDFINGIVGTVGRSPRTIPLTVTVRDLDRRQSVTVRSRVTDERSLDLGSSLGLAASVGLGQALAGALQSAPPRLTASMCLRVVIRERKRPLGFCNDYVDGERPFEDLDLALVLIDAFKYGRVTPVSASVRMRVRRGLDEALMLSARAPRRARPGQRIPIRIAFRRRRAGPGSVTFRYRVPRSTRPGKRTLTLRGPVPFSLLEGSAESLEVLLEGGGGSGLASEDEVGPRSLDELVGPHREPEAQRGSPRNLRPQGRGGPGGAAHPPAGAPRAPADPDPGAR